MNKSNSYPLSVVTLALAVLLGIAPTSSISGSPKRNASGSSSCRAAIVRFLEAPTANNFAAIGSVSTDECWPSLSDEQLQSLHKLVAEGNQSATQLLAHHVRQLDGGELEDALRSLGQFASHHMQDFMTLAKTGALTEREVTDALTMLPLELDDNFDAQLSELRARRAAIESLHDPQAQKQGKAAIDSINAFIAEVDRARLDHEAQKRQ